MKWSNDIANTIEWFGEISNRDQKEQAAAKIAERVKDGDVIGVGSGSTSFLALQAIGRRANEEGLIITAVPTSAEVALTCAVLGIPTTTLLQKRPDWAFDGADEVDTHGNLIKGRGGAMFAEKLVLKSAQERFILVDYSKMVKFLGEKFPVPVEVFPAAIHLVETELVSLGAHEIKMRPAKGKDGPVITEAGNFILDVRFKKIEADFERAVKAIPGVIESGLFIGYNVKVVCS